MKTVVMTGTGKPVRRVRLWVCKNCGNEVPVTNNMAGLNFHHLGPTSSILQCRACGSCTIQRATDNSFTSGEFLIIRTRNTIRGKG